MRRTATLLPVLLAAMLLVPVGIQAQAGESGPAPRLNVPQLIEKDLQEGLIDYSESLRLKITWFKKCDLLPEKYQSALDVTVRCGTPLLLEIDRNFDKLEKEDLAILAGIGLPDRLTILGGRPDYSFTLESSVIPLRVHYETADQLERAQKTLEVYEFSWARECGEIGFYEPPGDYGVDGSDDYDVYLSSTGTGVLGYTSPGQQVTDTWWDDRTSHIVHSRGLSSDAQISTTGSHEFNHACQMAMAYETSATFYENCATWVEPHVYFEYANDAWAYAWYCQREPQQAICWFDSSRPLPVRRVYLARVSGRPAQQLGARDHPRHLDRRPGQPGLQPDQLLRRHHPRSPSSMSRAGRGATAGTSTTCSPSSPSGATSATTSSTTPTTPTGTISTG